MAQTEAIIHAILVEPGQEPTICALPAEEAAQKEAISDLLEGNFGATEFFDLKNGVSLFILTNDLSVPLGLRPNRRFPGKDREEIIFGSAIFIAAYNGSVDAEDKEGTVDMPERICRMFIEQIGLGFESCKGDEKPDPKAEVYVENEGSDEERSYKWKEIEKPCGVETCKFLQIGRAKWLEAISGEILEINGRYFEQVTVRTKKAPLH